MAARIVLFGATGYTGRLAAEAMVERGLEPVLAARTPAKLDELAGRAGRRARDRGPPTWPTRRASRRWSSAATCSSRRSGRSRAGAARRGRGRPRSGAHYIDSTGEPHVHPRGVRALRAARRGGGHRDAHRDGLRLGAGQPRGALALDRAGELATRVDVGYFITGGGARPSGGTRASLVGAIVAPAFGFRDGRVQTERGAQARAELPGRLEGPGRGSRSGAPSTSRCPRVAPRLREVNAYLGWFGPASRAMQAFSACTRSA